MYGVHFAERMSALSAKDLCISGMPSELLEEQILYKSLDLPGKGSNSSILRKQMGNSETTEVLGTQFGA